MRDISKVLIGVGAFAVGLFVATSLSPRAEAQMGPSKLYVEQELNTQGRLVGWVVRDPDTGERVLLSYRGGCAPLSKR